MDKRKMKEIRKQVRSVMQIDNITNEIMDKIRDIVDRIDLKHYINNNTDEDMGDLDDEIYSIIHNELKTNLNK